MSLYLKYRPLDFNNLEGQTFIKKTLEKSIENNKTVGAYLFCGPRGTGKTSTARILAKTINCQNIKGGNPCLKCDICKDFLDEKLVDIIEIDAASHTGVDNVREIIEKSQFLPTRTKFKIYIIDEVHMLSKGAFNALLKILEEPPKHVKFILATTETHKVPETIISRCQRYDFKRISNDDIKNRLTFIAKEEFIKIDEKSLNFIAKHSAGGLRDAISHFEQFIVDGKIEYNNLLSALEIVDSKFLKDFFNLLLNKDKSIVDLYEKLIEDGINIRLFFKELMFFIKDEILNELKKGNNILEYINILEILDDTYAKTKNALDENMTFLIGILKIIQNYNNQQIEKLEEPRTIKKENKKNINIEADKKDKEVISTKEIETKLNHEDIADVFGNDNTLEKTAFSFETFVKKLKLNGAKGGLTMALRGSDISLNGNILNIVVKTKITKGQLENSENASLILKSMGDIGISNPEFKIS